MALCFVRRVSRESSLSWLKTWDYQNTRVDMLASPMFVLTNVGGLLVALTVGNRTGASLEAVFLTFSY